MPYHAGWYGFLLSRRRLVSTEAGYWSCSRGNGLWRYQLAGEEAPKNWGQTARTLLCSPEKDVSWIEYHDPANRQYRAARIVNGRLESCIYVAHTHELLDYDWLELLFEKSKINGNERIALLAGKPLSQQKERGPTVCACFNVGSETIRQAIRERRITSVEQITAELKAGGNCGSCLPELKALLHEVRNKSAA